MDEQIGITVYSEEYFFLVFSDGPVLPCREMCHSGKIVPSYLGVISSLDKPGISTFNDLMVDVIE